MAEKTILGRIIQKHDIEANWNLATDFIPKQGEIIVYDIDENYTYERFKIGDGVTNVNNLPFASVTPDWSINDPNAAGYIENRTHWIGTAEAPLTFDEDMTGKEVVEMGTGYYLVKMSDTPKTAEELIGSTLIIKQTPTEQNDYSGPVFELVIDETVIFPTYDSDVGSIIAVVNVYSSGSETPYIFSVQGDISETGFSLSEGVYFVYIRGDNAYIYTHSLSCLTGPQEVVHKLDKKYLPDFVSTVNGQTPDTNGNVDVTVPTKTSELTNDSGFITASDIPDVDVPTKISELENDAGYLNTTTGTDGNPQLRLPEMTTISSSMYLRLHGDEVQITDNGNTNSIVLDGMGGAQLNGDFHVQTPTANESIANKKYVDDSVAGLVDSAPATLNTLKELSAALGNDENFATTVATQIGNLETEIESVESRLPTAISSLRNDSGYITIDDVANEVYVGDGDMPEDATIQITLDDSDEEELLKDGLIEYINLELAKRGQLKPEFAQTIENCTDTTKLYVLPDGYIYAYISTETDSVSYTNLAEPLPENTTDTTKWIKGYRFGSSGEPSVEYNGVPSSVSNKFECTNGDIIRVKGVTLRPRNDRIVLYASDGNNMRSYFGEDIVAGNTIYLTYLGEENGVYTFQCDEHASGGLTIVGCRFAMQTPDDASQVIITVNEEITEATTNSTYNWSNTGHAFVPADYEERIVDLESELSDLSNTVEQLEQNITPTNIPTYWQTEIKNVAEQIKTARDIGGVQCVDFIWATDIHGTDTISEKGERFGHVVKAMMDAADIPLFIATGDIMGKNSYPTAQKARDEINLVKSWLDPIPYQMQALIMGNHDGAWGDSATGYYKKQLSINEMYNLIYRKQAMDFRRICDDDGTYYYIDNMTQGVRFIFLNSQYQPSDETDTNGNAVYDRFNTPCFGQKQLNWFVNTALDVPDGYHICLFAHDAYCGDWSQIVAIVNAFNATNTNQRVVNNTYSDSAHTWRNSTITADFKNTNAVIAGMFAGHVHYDCIRPASGDNSMMACPLIQMTTALGVDIDGKELLFGGTQPNRANGDVTEFALDIPVINKKERTITIIRLGAGNNRSVNY